MDNTLKNLSFEERIKQKSRQGFDSEIQNKEEILKRREKQKKIQSQPKGNNKDFTRSTIKKQPKQQFSKFPVSVIRPTFQEENNKTKVRDPRFLDKLRKGEQDVGFDRKKYDFLFEQQQENLNKLKQLKKQSKKSGNEQQLEKVRELIGQEKQFKQKVEHMESEQKLMTEIKTQNKERAKVGLDPVFKKKRDMKTMRYEKQFNDLEKSGKLDKFMKTKEEENDKKRQRVR